MKNLEFGRRLKQLREEKSIREGIKITQKMVAEAIHLTTEHYQKLEAGHVPKGETLGKLGEIFRCSVDWLLYGNGAPPHGVSEPEREEIKHQPPEPTAEYPTNAFAQAVAQLKTIFDNRDPTFTQMVVAGLNTFGRVIEENQELRNKINSLEKRIAELEAGVQREGGDVRGDTSVEGTGRSTEKKAG